MLDRFLAAVTDWPVLVQGALGSAFFWLILVAGQNVFAAFSARYAASSKARRKAYLMHLRLKYAYKTATDNPTRGAILTVLLYRAARQATYAAIWLTLGLLFSTLLPVLGAVGFIGCLYYLFAALSAVKPAEEVPDPKAKLLALTEEAKKLDEA